MSNSEELKDTAVSDSEQITTLKKEEKEKLVVTLHSIGDAFITTNERGYVEYMKPVAEELLGWRRQKSR